MGVLHGWSAWLETRQIIGLRQRIYLSKRTDSTPPASSKHLPTQPLPMLCLQYTPTTWLSDRAGGGRGGVGKCFEDAGGEGVLSVLLLIYIFGLRHATTPLGSTRTLFLSIYQHVWKHDLYYKPVQFINYFHLGLTVAVDFLVLSFFLV